MRTQYLFISSLLVLAAILLAACGGTSAAPPTANPPATAPNPAEGATPSNVPQLSKTNSDSSLTFDSQTVEGGSVTVKVTLLKWESNAPLEFDIVMDTHSEDLADDMLKAVILRDESGKESTPTAWDGPGGGGHHREGKIKFAALTANTKSLTLIVKNIAGVPERTYQWELPR